MLNPSPISSVTPDFLQAFRGSFTSLLKWPDLDAFWQVLEQHAGDGWYIYAIGEAVPQTPASADQVRKFILEVDKLLREEHEEDYCGIVYADDKTRPSFIKIYDPNNLGVTCGFSDNPPMPGWVLSLLPPVELNETTFLPQNRRRWWQRLFA
ncbi:MAG: hypothetical protein GC149_09595 [Gammaproteobacteria bacterium]|nr:hypothetical protein [Gammaproteobacteria bacterium]